MFVKKGSTQTSGIRQCGVLFNSTIHCDYDWYL